MRVRYQRRIIRPGIKEMKKKRRRKGSRRIMKEFLPFRLDSDCQCLWRGEERIDLTPKAFSVLEYLVDRSGLCVAKIRFASLKQPSPRNSDGGDLPDEDVMRVVRRDS